jgi:ketosteroid isomerase-like protein
MDSVHHLSAHSVDEFCCDWIAAWNAHDLERILSHYRDDVAFTSPFVARAGAPDGVLHGLPALRSYFEQALATYPDLHFEAIAALSGVGSVALYYRSVEGRQAIEVMHLDQRCRVHRASAHYTSGLVRVDKHERGVR